MKKMSIMFVAALSLAAIGCKKNGADCGKAITNSMEISKASMGQADDKTKAKLKDIGVKHCQDDKWADDTVQCMTDAKTEAEGKTCYGKLTAEQQKKMNTEAMETMMPPTPPHTGGGDTAGSAPAGSGSAAAPN